MPSQPNECFFIESNQLPDESREAATGLIDLASSVLASLSSWFIVFYKAIIFSIPIKELEENNLGNTHIPFIILIIPQGLCDLIKIFVILKMAVYGRAPLLQWYITHYKNYYQAKWLPKE